MKRAVIKIFMGSLLLFHGLPARSFAQTQTVFNPTDDAFVISSNPTSNNGSATDLRVVTRNTIEVLSFLKFDVSGITGTVQSAKIRLTVT
ncbi:MAG: DNRLRE domain-containing protein, partial [bacterium]